MRIIPIQQNINFKSKLTLPQEPLILGYSDDATSAFADKIRDRLFCSASLCETKNSDLENSVTNTLLSSLKKKCAKIGIKNEILKAIPLDYVEIIEGMKDSYRGTMPISKPELFKNMKEAGIERVVNLTETTIIPNCEKYGLEGLDFDIYNYLNFNYKAEMFRTDNDAANEVETLYRGCGAEFISNKIKETLNCRAKKLVVELSKFVEFIKFMQKEKLYIGCGWGNYRTSHALTLNHYFNPKAAGTSSYEEDYYIRNASTGLQNLCNNLRIEDKQAMGWSAEYDGKLLERLRKLSDKK